ncbi:MAG: hypothetical protein QOJ04_4993 [Caballeronia sp.]|jgi:hypothetical protein|nr:hypothetical protein [Caballeronia sp.]
MGVDSNFWQVNSWKAAVIAGLITAFLAVVQAIVATLQRRRELRWKQAETGRDLMDKLLDEPLSNAALLMLDSDVRIYKIGEKESARIAAADMLAALCAQDPPQEAIHEFVRDAFDTLYYYLDRCEHFIAVGLTTTTLTTSPRTSASTNSTYDLRDTLV